MCCLISFKKKKRKFPASPSSKERKDFVDHSRAKEREEEEENREGEFSRNGGILVHAFSTNFFLILGR